MGRRLTGVAVALAVLCATAAAFAQHGLRGGGRDARTGVHTLRASFTPDPFELATRGGGALHAAAMGLGAGCRGYVDARPDVVLRFSGAAAFLRVFVRSSSDVTLIVAEPGGRFLCNDDAVPGRNTNPVIDVYQPRAGQYDVWIGGHARGEEVAATLFVTTARTTGP
ncbi:MAG: nodulation protein NodZ [Myxococcota bacterium]|nr:nodulation protein NodZ [Myxococcota bacterium]